MKLLLDENLPHTLRTLLIGHDCYTAAYMGWSGVANGSLLRLAAENHFDALITTDKGIEYEQSMAPLPVAVVILVAKDNKLQTLQILVPFVLQTLNHLKPQEVVKVSAL